MSLHTKLFGLCLMAFTLGLAGCETGSTETAAPPQDELAEYLAENPEVLEEADVILDEDPSFDE